MDTTVDQRFRQVPNRPFIGGERSGHSTQIVVRLGVRIQRLLGSETDPEDLSTFTRRELPKYAADSFVVATSADIPSFA